MYSSSLTEVLRSKRADDAATGSQEFFLTQGFSSLRPTYIRRAIYLTQPVDSNIHLIEKHIHKHIQNNIWPNI